MQTLAVVKNKDKNIFVSLNTPYSTKLGPKFGSLFLPKNVHFSAQIGNFLTFMLSVKKHKLKSRLLQWL